MFIAMNIVTVNPDLAERFEEAFRRRAGQVENAAGFVSFEVLRSTSESEYVVLTRWQTPDDFQRWLQSDSFSQAHAGGGSGAGMTAMLKTYDVVQEVKGSTV